MKQTVAVDVYAFGDDIIIGGLNHLVWPAAAQHVWVPQQFLPHAFCGCDRVVSALKHFCVSLFFVHGCFISWFFWSSGNFFRSESDSEIGKEKARCIWMWHEAIPFPDNEGFNVCWSLASCDLFIFWAQKATVMRRLQWCRNLARWKPRAGDQLNLTF